MTHSFWFWFIVWFVGYISAYLFARNSVKDDWTIGLRAQWLFMAILSWITFIICIIDKIMGEIDTDKHTKW